MSDKQPWRYNEVYTDPEKGRYMITDGLCQISVHPTYNGSGRLRPDLDRHPGGVVISVNEATAYAEFILAALNAAGEVKL